MRIRHILASVSIAVSASAFGATPKTSLPTPLASPCNTAGIRAVAKELECVEARNGFVLASKSEAPQLAAVIDDAARLFALHFEAPSKPIALIASMDVGAGAKAAVENRGYLAMPWISEAAMREVRERGVRKQIAQMATVTAEQREAVVQKVLSQMKSGDSDGGALAHELAHRWFLELYDQNRPKLAAKQSSARYGSSAPDWLDEMAAVLTEGDSITRSRRELLRKTAKDGEIRPLKVYFTIEHPMLAGVGQDIPTKCEGICMHVLSGADAQRAVERSKGAAAYYVQSRAFADFMLERTRNPKVFVEIAQHVRAGKSMSEWLAGEGARYALGSTVDALQKQWDAWLATKVA